MKCCTIRMKNDEDVSLVCSITNTYYCDVDAVCGRYTVDAKSLMGLMMLMNKDVDIVIHTEVYRIQEELHSELEDWIV